MLRRLALCTTVFLFSVSTLHAGKKKQAAARQAEATARLTHAYEAFTSLPQKEDEEKPRDLDLKQISTELLEEEEQADGAAAEQLVEEEEEEQSDGESAEQATQLVTTETVDEAILAMLPFFFDKRVLSQFVSRSQKEGLIPQSTVLIAEILQIMKKAKSLPPSEQITRLQKQIEEMNEKLLHRKPTDKHSKRDRQKAKDRKSSKAAAAYYDDEEY